MGNFEEIFKKVLALFGFKEHEIKKVITDLDQVILLETVEQLTEKLPHDKKEHLRQAAQANDDAKDQENLVKTLQEHYSEKEFNSQLSITAFEVVSDYIEGQLKYVTEDKKNQVLKLLSPNAFV